MKRLEIVAPKQLHATVQLPSSKSICNRALIINALAGGTYLPENLSDCDDTTVMLRALRDMPDTIDIMAAGTAMRFLTAYLSIAEGEHTITGTERMQNRPIGILVDALRSLGADIRYVGKEGFPPLHIKGTVLNESFIELPGNVSSQYISALLMIAPMMPKGLTIRLKGDIVSLPYIQMTLQLMRRFGAQADWNDGHELCVAPSPYRAQPYFVEADWSAASYWYEMVALCSEAEIRLPGLFQDSTQGDARVAEWFRRLGVETIYEPEGVVLRKSTVRADRLDIDFVEQPDLAQTFVVTACLLGIPFHFTGLQSLKIKETDRITALKNEMRKLGFLIHDANDAELYWDGKQCAADTTAGIDTYEDHRMAMAFAPAAFRVASLIINDPQVVSKSYPAYWKHFEQVGFQVKEIELC